jgi:hypothetical protein
MLAAGIADARRHPDEGFDADDRQCSQVEDRLAEHARTPTRPVATDWAMVVPLAGVVSGRSPVSPTSLDRGW